MGAGRSSFSIDSKLDEISGSGDTKASAHVEKKSLSKCTDLALFLFRDVFRKKTEQKPAEKEKENEGDSRNDQRKSVCAAKSRPLEAAETELRKTQWETG